MSDLEARLAEVLREHGRFGSRYCGCGARVVEGEHRAHVAVVLASIVADEAARAVEGAADTVQRVADENRHARTKVDRQYAERLDRLAVRIVREAKP